MSIARSKRAGKKYAAVVAGPGGRRRVVHFGAKGYEQFKDSTQCDDRTATVSQKKPETPNKKLNTSAHSIMHGKKKD